MKSKLLTEYTSEELKIEVKKRKGIFLSMCILITILAFCGIFLTIKNGFGVFTFLPIFFITFLMINWKNFNDAKKELKTRIK